MNAQQRHNLMFGILDVIQSFLDDLSRHPSLKPIVERLLRAFFTVIFSVEKREYMYVAAVEEAA